MPPTLTYPGVYIQELPSGVRTITGVSTSVTAFVGAARRGPIDEAVHVLGFADFERRFGGLQEDAELGYAVRQFFQNGGADAWVIRIAKNAAAASLPLVDAAAADVLVLTARDEGNAGNLVEVAVDHDTANPASTFSLVLAYADPDDPTQNRREAFADLSMNSGDPRYAVDVINDGSQLVAAERVADLAAIAAVKGRSVSGVLEDAGGNPLDVAVLIETTHTQFQVVVGDAAPVAVVINPATDITGATETTRLTSLCAAIQTQVRAVLGAGAFNCTRDGRTIVLEDNVPGEHSRVRVLAGARNDASARLKLGTLNGGTETDAVAALRPVEMPDHGTLAGAALAGTDLDGLPSPTSNSLLIGLDGYGPDPVTLDLAPITAGGAIGPKIEAIATNLQDKVRAVKKAQPAYSDFTAVRDGDHLLLSSGSRGKGSVVSVQAAPANDIAGALKLLAAATVTAGTNVTLAGGHEEPYTDADVYNLIIADRASRKGLYALESVDLFNLVCLPGVTDAGLLADTAAYCTERRAFLIVDAPKAQTDPDAMADLARGASLPNTDHAAVYFPWTKIADPVKGGKLRVTAPCGTIAGLYARTDANRGVWKAPAGTDATLTGVQGATHVLTDGENGVVNPRGVNAIRILPAIGPVAWGARTLRGDDQLADEYKYIPIRRLALYLEESLYRGTQWVVFEPNDEPLWAQIRLNVGAFMHNLFRQGAFQGKTPQDAYLVRCDSQTTTQNDIDLGVVNVLVGFAPLKPAEFVVIQIQQQAGQIEA
jgi:phage tail sheath protein FI